MALSRPFKEHRLALLCRFRVKQDLREIITVVTNLQTFSTRYCNLKAKKWIRFTYKPAYLDITSSKDRDMKSCTAAGDVTRDSDVRQHYYITRVDTSSASAYNKIADGKRRIIRSNLVVKAEPGLFDEGLLQETDPVLALPPSL